MKLHPICFQKSGNTSLRGFLQHKNLTNEKAGCFFKPLPILHFNLITDFHIHIPDFHIQLFHVVSKKFSNAGLYFDRNRGSHR